MNLLLNWQLKKILLKDPAMFSAVEDDSRNRIFSAIYAWYSGDPNKRKVCSLMTSIFNSFFSA